MTLPAIKRLRFPYHVAPDESVCGAFTAACHDHRLRNISSGLEGAGIKLPRPGHLQFAGSATLAAAAAVMRTEPTWLEALAFCTGADRNTIMLGDLAMPRAAFEFGRRRIAPTTLTAAPHHRAAWLNLLLPYCPDTLERLVDACPDCGPLGWRHSRGIARCDLCGKTVPASPEPPFNCRLAERYRLAADLMSRDAIVGAAALARLPDGVTSSTRSTVVDLVIRAGVVARGARSGRVIEALTTQTAPVAAATICLGIDMLSDWPRAIRAFAAERTDDMGDDTAAYEALRADLRWIGKGGAGAKQLITAAFPKIDGPTSDTFATATRYYTASQTNSILWTVSKEHQLLRDARAVTVETLPSNVRLRARYKADDVDALRAALDDSAARRRRRSIWTCLPTGWIRSRRSVTSKSTTGAASSPSGASRCRDSRSTS